METSIGPQYNRRSGTIRCTSCRVFPASTTHIYQTGVYYAVCFTYMSRLRQHCSSAIPRPPHFLSAVASSHSLPHNIVVLHATARDIFTSIHLRLYMAHLQILVATKSNSHCLCLFLSRSCRTTHEINIFIIIIHSLVHVHKGPPNESAYRTIFLTSSLLQTTYSSCLPSLQTLSSSKFEPGNQPLWMRKFHLHESENHTYINNVNLLPSLHPKVRNNDTLNLLLFLLPTQVWQPLISLILSMPLALFSFRFSTSSAETCLEIFTNEQHLLDEQGGMLILSVLPTDDRQRLTMPPTASILLSSPFHFINFCSNELFHLLRLTLHLPSNQECRCFPPPQKIKLSTTSVQRHSI